MSSEAPAFRIEDEPPVESPRTVSLDLWAEDFTTLSAMAEEHGLSLSELARRILDFAAVQFSQDQPSTKKLTFWCSRATYKTLLDSIPKNMGTRALGEMLSRVASEERAKQGDAKRAKQL